ncbi:MAG: ANTAR domain-containing response regulator [Burkholderiales bacterium]
MLRVLLFEELPDRAEAVREGLAHAGHDIVASISAPLDLLPAIERAQPDVIVLDTESPSRDVLEHLCVVSQSSPRPIVMFASDGGGEAIREAVRAGVSAYVVDGLDAGRIKSIVDVACARFEEFQRLKIELAEANLKLSERKLVARAKGLLMASRGLSEDQAYHALRRLAMSRKLRMGEVAQQLIDAAQLLGKG